MRKIELSQMLRRSVAIVLSVAMVACICVVGWLYVSPRQRVDSLSKLIGRLSLGADWSVRLKDNTFFPQQELSSEYAFIRSLVDYMKMELRLDFLEAPQNAKITYQYAVDGTLRVENGNGANEVLLLEQTFPSMFSGSGGMDQQNSFAAVEKFDIKLSAYENLVYNFQRTYEVVANAQLQLLITFQVGIETDASTRTQELVLLLTIPLTGTIFSVEGTPFSSVELVSPSSIFVDIPLPIGKMLFAFAGMLLALAGILYIRLYTKPRQEDEETETLRRLIAQCDRGRMVYVHDDPRGIVPDLALSDFTSLLRLSDEVGQPVLVHGTKQSTQFFVRTQDTLYSYSLLQELQQKAGAAQPY